MFGFVLENASFRGRARRLDYWLMVLLGPVILTVLGAIVVMLLGRTGLVIMAVIVLLAMIANAGVHVRRLHDRGMSAHWLWIFWGIPTALEVAGAFSRLPSVQAFCAMVGLFIGLWCMIELGFLRGTDGPNPYGDDPVRD